MADVVFNKIETIQRCLKRVNEEYRGFEEEFYSNYTKQDSIILNLERASQATIDIAAHIIKSRNLGIPKSSRDMFVLLQRSGYISEDISKKMQNMIGFRNIAVHDYQNLNLEIVVAIIKHHLKDFEQFINEVFNSYLSS